MGSEIGKLFGSNGEEEKEGKKASGAEWISKVAEGLIKSPVVTNVSFGFILIALERLLEMQFECPCKTLLRNKLSAWAFFAIPAFLSFLLMLVMKIQECKCGDMASMFEHTISSVVPAIIWLILMFLNGQYFTCAMTAWEGRFVELDGASSQKWCEPFANATCDHRGRPRTRQQCMIKSQEYFVTSQCVGIGLLGFMCLALIYYLIGKHWRKKYRNDTPAQGTGTDGIPLGETNQEGGGPPGSTTNVETA